MGELLSVEDIARDSGLEESLIRFYESEYAALLPAKVLRGNALFFEREAVGAFRKIHALHASQNRSKRPPADVDQYARVIAITSGKGGVGKTNIALNLAIALQQLGKMCVVLDADMGLANVHLLAGLNPQRRLEEVLSEGASVADVLMSGPAGIGFIPGGSGILGLADSSRRDRMRIIDSLIEVEKNADYILVDTGAGIGPQVRDFLSSADEILFVLTSDITSLADAYGLLKVLCHDLPELKGRTLYSVVNMVETLKQAAGVALRFSGCARQFLGLEIHTIGYIMRDSVVGAATARRTPYCLFRPQARASKNIHNVALALLNHDKPQVRTGSAFGRYRNLLRQEGARQTEELMGLHKGML